MNDNFWDVHNIFFLIGLVFIPRLTVIFFSAVTGGLLFWIAFLIFPRIVIPILAAYHYWDTNPVLVILAFVICLSVETGEKTVVKRKVISRRPTEFIDV
jgi:hypothetical protein